MFGMILTRTHVLQEAGMDYGMTVNRKGNRNRRS